LKPSKSASNAGNPRSFNALQTVDFPAPEIPVTQMSGRLTLPGRARAGKPDCRASEDGRTSGHRRAPRRLRIRRGCWASHNERPRTPPAACPLPSAPRRRSAPRPGDANPLTQERSTPITGRSPPDGRQSGALLYSAIRTSLGQELQLQVHEYPDLCEYPTLEDRISPFGFSTR